jgi:hypothetical protein
METVPMHITHAVLLAAIAYVAMRFLLAQSHTVALTRSTLVGAVALIYMILFGHGLPSTRINI